MKIFSIIFFLFVVLLGVSFAILNASPVELNYYFGNREISLSLLLALTLGVGALIGFICALPSLFKLRHSNSKLRSRVKTAEKEIDNLRAIPIKDSH